jgi:hypothetical protein
MNTSGGGKIDYSLGGTVNQIVNQLKSRVNILESQAKRINRVYPTSPENPSYIVVRGGNSISVLGSVGVKSVTNVPVISSTLFPGEIDSDFTELSPASPSTFPDGLGYGDLVERGSKPRRVIVGNWKQPFTGGGDFYKYFSPLQMDILRAEVVSVFGRCSINEHVVYILGGL